MANVRSEYTVGLKDEVSAPLARITSGFDKFKGALAALGGIGAAGAIAAVTARIASAVNVADQLNRTSQKIGVTVESLSALNYAAKLADVSSESFAGALGKLSKNMAAAAEGSQAQAAAFNSIGVAVKNTDGTLRKADDVLADIAKAFAKLPDGATKTALAMQLFGRAGAELIPLLNDNADGFKAVTKEAQQFGVIISKDLAQQSDALKDNLDRLAAASSAIGISLAKDVVPAMANLATEFVKNYREASGLLKTFDALGATIANLAGGSDQERLGKLLTDEIGLEKEIRDLQASFDKGDTGRLPFTIKMSALREELAAVKAEAEGLKTVLQPAQQGAGRATGGEQFGPTATDEQLKRNEARVRAALDGVAAAKKEAAEREKLVKTQDDYLAKLREAAAIQGDATELAKVEADIKFGAAAKFSKETQDEARRLAGNVDLIKDTIEVQTYMNGLVRERAQLEEQSTAALVAHRQALIESLQTPLEKYVATIKELQSAGIGGELLQRGIVKARTELEAADAKALGLRDTARDLGLTFSSAFAQAVTGGEKLMGVINGLARDISTILLNKAITTPLANLLTGTSGSPGLLEKGAGWLGKWIGGLLGRAGGGPVSGGQAYVVGENGPELFVSNHGGRIIPNGGSAGGDLKVTIINFSRERVTARRDGGGRRELEITVGQLMAGNIQSGRGASAGMLPALAPR